MLSIIGKPATGKSAIAFLISSFISKHIFYSTQAEALDRENLEALRNEIKNSKRRKIVLLLDDFSFAVTGRSKKDRERLKNLMELRHILFEDKRYYIILIGHYVRSLAPVLRSSHIKVLTYLDAAELNLYLNEYMFSQSSLLAYFEYLQEKQHEKLYLVSFGTYEKIMNLTFTNIRQLTQRKRMKTIGPWTLYKMRFGKRKLLNINNNNMKNEVSAK